MLGFVIKKTLCDMWDNLFHIVLLNLGLLVTIAFLIYIPLFFQDIPSIFFMILFIGIVLVSVYMGAASGMCRDLSDYRSPNFDEFIAHLRKSYTSSLSFAFLNALIILIIYFSLLYLKASKAPSGRFILSGLLWIALIWMGASLYFFAIQSRLDNEFKKIMKKMFLVMFDNLGLTVLLLLLCPLLLIISSFTAFIWPGIASVILLVNVALKLTLYKYDYLKEHPDVRRNEIPWNELLLDDKEKLGERTLKRILFPWKE